MRGVTVMTLVRGVRIMPRRGGGRIAVWQSEQRPDRTLVDGPGDCRLGLSDPEAGVGDLGGSSLREHRCEGDTKWDENGLLLHETGNICVPMSNCQVSGNS
jgi:hypothetical protein